MWDIWDMPRSGRPRLYDKDTEDHLIAFYCQTTPLPENGRWTLRWAESELAIHPELLGVTLSRSTIQRILLRHELRPHRTRYFLQITDPNFFPKMERLIALYRNPPKNLFCFDECPGIQILQRIVPNLRPTDEDAIKVWWQEFEYIRNGTTDLFCFLEVQTGLMAATCQPNHTTEVFVNQFRKHAANQPSDERLDYIMDNLSSHCSYKFCELIAELSGIVCPNEKELRGCDERREWLQQESKRIVIHFTPFHGSWLNMAEICFRIIGEKCLKESYSSPEEIQDAIYAYVEEWNQNWAHPFNWKYDGSGLHQKALQRFTAALSHSASKMTLQYLTKSCGLMVNLLKDYTADIEDKYWQQLFTVLSENECQLRERIQHSSQPRVSQKAIVALEDLLRCSSDYMAAA
jgi:transposase